MSDTQILDGRYTMGALLGQGSGKVVYHGTDTAHHTRLHYAKFRQMGLQSGLGSMESGCKQIGLEHLKIAGTH